MKYILITTFFLLSGLLLANESKLCQKCHPIIYSEYYQSSHKNASTYNNPIHKAMWDKHPKNEKGYTCAKCHSPSDIKSVQTGELTNNSIQKDEAISCVFCHTIKTIEEGNFSNINVSTGKKKEFFTAEKGKKGKAKYETVTSWFGLVKESKNSPYHTIDYSNENYYTGNVCMGCHSHTNNEHSFDITMLDAVIDEKDTNTCVTCHMPQVMGTKVTINETKTHAYHGIAGIYHKSEKMGMYIDFKLFKNTNNFVVNVINKSNHAFFGQAFRQGILKAEISRNGKIIELEPFVFERILGKDGKEVMPWNANMALKDTLVYAKREVVFKEVLLDGDNLKLTLGIKMISKDGLKKLGLKDNNELTKFRVLKTQKFNF
ncbi:MAG: hypothetical protein COB17_04700 [Sulfurimonas sp.]|nr:MAG: hypothetical protein COB17_04700 [Sulfurimonas sp.]